MFNWFQSKEQKCERLGHDYAIAKFKVITTRTRWRGVAANAVMSRQICKRCNAQFGSDKFTNLKDIHSLSMPSDSMDKLRKNGHLIRSAISVEPIAEPSEDFGGEDND